MCTDSSHCGACRYVLVPLRLNVTLKSTNFYVEFLSYIRKCSLCKWDHISYNGKMASHIWFPYTVWLISAIFQRGVPPQENIMPSVNDHLFYLFFSWAEVGNARWGWEIPIPERGIILNISTKVISSLQKSTRASTGALAISTGEE